MLEADAVAARGPVVRPLAVDRSEPAQVGEHPLEQRLARRGARSRRWPNTSMRHRAVEPDPRLQEDDQRRFGRQARVRSVRRHAASSSRRSCGVESSSGRDRERVLVPEPDEQPEEHRAEPGSPPRAARGPGAWPSSATGCANISANSAGCASDHRGRRGMAAIIRAATVVRRPMSRAASSSPVSSSSRSWSEGGDQRPRGWRSSGRARARSCPSRGRSRAACSAVRAGARPAVRRAVCLDLGRGRVAQPLAAGRAAPRCRGVSPR